MQVQADIRQVMIAYRILILEKRLDGGGFRSRNLNIVVASIIESGAIYSAWLIALIATFATNSFGHYVVFDAVRISSSRAVSILNALLPTSLAPSVNRKQRNILRATYAQLTPSPVGHCVHAYHRPDCARSCYSLAIHIANLFHTFEP